MKKQIDPAEERLEKSLFPEQPMPPTFDPYAEYLQVEHRPLDEMDSEVRVWCEEVDKLIDHLLLPDPSFINLLNERDES